METSLNIMVNNSRTNEYTDFIINHLNKVKTLADKGKILNEIREVQKELYIFTRAISAGGNMTLENTVLGLNKEQREKFFRVSDLMSRDICDVKALTLFVNLFNDCDISVKLAIINDLSISLACPEQELTDAKLNFSANKLTLVICTKDEDEEIEEESCVQFEYDGCQLISKDGFSIFRNCSELISGCLCNNSYVELFDNL